MNEYGAAAHVALWITGVGISVYLFLTIMVLQEIRKFDRWSEQRFRGYTRRHTEAMRRLDHANAHRTCAVVDPRKRCHSHSRPRRGTSRT